MIRTTKLKNGVRIATMHVNSITASVGVFMGAGAVHEKENEHGLGHFLEHMAFKGTKTRSVEDIAEFIEFSGGSSNAYTTYSHTAYYANVLVSEVNNTVEIILDSVFNSVFPEMEIETERNVIKQEIKRGSDNPDSLCFFNLHKAIYKSQPLGSNIIGTEDSISKFVKSDFQNFVNKWYTAGNTVIVAAGNIDHDEFVKHVSNIVDGLITQPVEIPKQSTFSSGIEIHDKKFDQTSIALAFETPTAHDIFETQVIELLSRYISGGMGSPLYKEVREKRGLVYFIDSNASAFADSGYFSIAAGTTEESVEEVIKVSLDQIEGLLTNFEDKHLQRAKNQIKVVLGRHQESPGGVMRYIGGNWINGDKFLLGFDELFQIADSITADDLKRAASNILNSKKAFSIVGPISDKTVNYMETHI